MSTVAPHPEQPLTEPPDPFAFDLPELPSSAAIAADQAAESERAFKE